MAERLDNCFLINAPAGSGKTTYIKEILNKELSSNSDDNILCITYTNRASEELAIGMESEKLSISTIHAFLNNFMKPFFQHNEIIELYFKLYKEDIKNRIKNIDKKDNICTSNAKYVDKYGDLSFEVVKNNVKSIYYNELSNNTLFYGGLSHDDLITFTSKAFKEFPILYKKISSRYQSIFIDEYQDTSADILNLFYRSIEGTNSKLYLFGDKMQQIYKNYDGSFERELAQFDTTLKLSINYRSCPKIVDILNNLYNESEFNQGYSNKTRALLPDFEPKVIFTKKMELSLAHLNETYPDTLTLYLFNRNRFTAIGAENLFNLLSKMEQYKFGRKHQSPEILLTRFDDNPDQLIKLMYFIAEMSNNYTEKRYGVIIQAFKKYKNIFNAELFSIATHGDKISVMKTLERIFSVYRDEDKTIRDILNMLDNEKVIHKNYFLELIETDEYQPLLDVLVIEIHNIVEYLNNPYISTQHGVKGESYDSVIFVAEDSIKNAPYIHMYSFLSLLSVVDVSFNSFQKLDYQYEIKLEETEKLLGYKVKDLDSSTFQPNKEFLIIKARELLTEFNEDEIFEFLCKSDCEDFISNPTLKNLKKCFKKGKVSHVLTAYKIFYVGCSRARKNLTILIDANKIGNKSEMLQAKFRSIGFTIDND